MAKTLLVYHNDEVIKEEPESPTGKTTVTISGLDSNTDYNTGHFKVSWLENGLESDKKDVPSFKTDTIAVTSIEVSEDTLAIDVGTQAQINATVQPSNADVKDVTYSSNNKAVATVTDNGMIEAIKSGNATITVKSVDNSQVIAKVKVAVEDIEDTQPEEPVEEQPTE